MLSYILTTYIHLSTIFLLSFVITTFCFLCCMFFDAVKKKGLRKVKNQDLNEEGLNILDIYIYKRGLE